jgi:hypothetical protein
MTDLTPNSFLAAMALLLAVHVNGVCAAPPRCLDYGGETVALAGKLHRATFPGRPNYESIADGDEPETGFYLTLAEPICTNGNKWSEGFGSVTEIQLILNQQQYGELRPKLGSVVQLKGKISAAISGHHHASVLLEVDAPSNLLHN